MTVVAVGLPPRADWTANFRAVPAVQRYVLLAPPDADACGERAETWGQRPWFADRAPAPLPWRRSDLPAVSAEVHVVSTLKIQTSSAFSNPEE